jgi:putative ABC transport system substrate-binding protein
LDCCRSRPDQIAAKELVALQPDLLIAITTPETLALTRETTTIPIIFMQVSDPVGSGLVTNLARPGGNITGFTNFEYSMGGKWLATLKEISPQIEHVGVLFNPATAPYAKFYVNSVEAAAPSLGVRVEALPLHDLATRDDVIAAFAKDPSGALIVISDIFTTVNREHIVTAAAKFRLPTIYPFKFFTAVYADRILKGAKAADLPIQNQLSLNWLSILRPPRHSASRCPRRCLPAPTT